MRGYTGLGAAGDAGSVLAHGYLPTVGSVMLLK
jgi:hypothetical protein